MRQIDFRKGWWEPREIVFESRQCVWLVSELPTLEVGNWPPIPQNEVLAKHERPKGGAYFETPAQIWVEITTRLDRCGRDGEMLKDFYLWNKTDREMAIAYNMDIYDIEHRVRRALRYISGWRRRTRTYEEFVSHRRTAVVG